MVRIGNGRVAVLADAAAKRNVLLSETTAEGKQFRRASCGFSGRIFRSSRFTGH
jgi:hypothetical protein